jgi:hypothetical protein
VAVGYLGTGTLVQAMVARADDPIAPALPLPRVPASRLTEDLVVQVAGDDRRGLWGGEARPRVVALR